MLACFVIFVVVVVDAAVAEIIIDFFLNIVNVVTSLHLILQCRFIIIIIIMMIIIIITIIIIIIIIIIIDEGTGRRAIFVLGRAVKAAPSSYHHYHHHHHHHHHHDLYTVNRRRPGGRSRPNLLHEHHLERPELHKVHLGTSVCRCVHLFAYTCVTSITGCPLRDHAPERVCSGHTTDNEDCDYYYYCSYQQLQK